MEHWDTFDVVSDVFSVMRMRGELYFRADLIGEFAVAIPQQPGSIRFHLVRSGQCFVRVAGRSPIALFQGDLVLIPAGAAQVLSSAPDLPPVPLADVVARYGIHDGVLTAGSHSGDGVHNSLLCGYCSFGQMSSHPLLVDLPEAILLRHAELGSDPWLAAALRLLSLEADLTGQGSVAVLTRLVEIIVIQHLRHHSRGSENATNRFVRGLYDPKLMRALVSMHRSPAEPWTIQTLARQTGMSRARFAERFAAQLGMPPIEYLTLWRLMKAATMLAETNLNTAEIAERCGYASLPSFSRRFKHHFGSGPGHYRRHSARL